MKSFNVPIIYRSPLISVIKKRRKDTDKLKKDFSPTKINLGEMNIFLARHFGFCYGVENAIEIAYRTIEENKGKRIFLLSEMIHNPQVNADLLQHGVQFIMDTKGNYIIQPDSITKNDIVIIPAFGTTLELEKLFANKGIHLEKYNTTCPFVEKVWNRSEQIAQKGYSIVIHGKPMHEETRATFSHASVYAPSVVIKDMSEAIELGKYITKEKKSEQFYEEFKGRYSANFNIHKDLKRFGVVNQTTQLASDTQAISDYLKTVVQNHYNVSGAELENYFADTRDTLCYATNDNQTAVIGLLNEPADLAIVIGGYNSSNTTHLVELCEKVLPTYFISSEEKILSKNEILHFNYHSKKEEVIFNFIPDKKPLNILITSGASCPDVLVENVIRKLCQLFNLEKELDNIIDSFSK